MTWKTHLFAAIGSLLGFSMTWLLIWGVGLTVDLFDEKPSQSLDFLVQPSPPKPKPTVPKPNRQQKAQKTTKQTASKPKLSSQSLSSMSKFKGQFWLDKSVLQKSLEDNSKRLALVSEVVDVKPVPVQRSAMPYPAWARSEGIEGFVKAQMLISDTGEVRKVRIVESKPKGIFDTTAIEFLKTWRFRPALFKGEVVSVWSEQKLRFELH